MRGRKPASKIRNNILEILDAKKKAYGREIYRDYIKLFPKVHIKSIYYHLKKGVSLGEVKAIGFKKEKGNYSWGDEAEKAYYSLGPKARVKTSEKVKKFFSQ